MTEDITTGHINSEDDAEGSPDEHAEPVAVAVHPDPGEAEVTVAHLAANGIEAFIVDQVEGGLVPIEGEWGVAVVVKAVDADLAREILASSTEIPVADETDTSSAES